MRYVWRRLHNGWMLRDNERERYHNIAWVLERDSAFRLWHDEGAHGGWSPVQPIPEGLTLDEAKAYVLAMWRMSQ